MKKSFLRTSIFVLDDNSPREITVFLNPNAEDVLEDVYQVVLKDPSILNVSGDFALMVHEGRTAVIMKASHTAITVERRFGTARTKFSALANMVDTVAELIEGKVETYAV